MIIHCCRIVNGIKNKNTKNSLGATLCTKDKNRSPFHGEKPLMIKWFLERGYIKSPKTILHGRDAIFRVHAKWLIFNIVSQLLADVKYHVPTGFFAEGERFQTPSIYPLNPNRKDINSKIYRRWRM